MGFQIGNLLTLCKNPDPAFKPRLGCCVFVWDTCLDRPFVHKKGDEIVRWTENKSSGDSLLWTKSDNIPGRVKPRKEEQPPPLPRTFFLLQTLFGKGTLLSQCSLHPRVSVIGVMSGKLDKLLGEGGGSWPVIDQRPTERSTLESLHFMNSPCITKYNTRDQTQYWATAHLPLPLTKIDPYLLSVDYCRVRGGVSAQLLRCWHWSYTSSLFSFLLIFLELV